MSDADYIARRLLDEPCPHRPPTCVCDNAEEHRARKHDCPDCLAAALREYGDERAESAEVERDALRAKFDALAEEKELLTTCLTSIIEVARELDPTGQRVTEIAKRAADELRALAAARKETPIAQGDEPAPREATCAGSGHVPGDVCGGVLTCAVCGHQERWVPANGTMMSPHAPKGDGT